jgi:undecaprenyl-diphosphatase
VRLAVAFLLVAVLLGIALPRTEAPALDRAATQSVQQAVDGTLGEALRLTSAALYAPWNVLAAVLLSLLVWRFLDGRLALVVLVGVLGAMTASHGLKRVVLRQRPTPAVADGGSVNSEHAYPSGHVTFTAAALGSLVLCASRCARRRWRWGTVALAVSGTAWVALSRIWLGRHWLTDTVGGALVGVGVLLLAAALLGPRSAQGAGPSAGAS